MSSEEPIKIGLPPIPADIGRITGPPYLGIVLNWWLFGILTLQYYLYYLNFPDDRRLLKYAVHFVFLVEITQTCFTVGDGFHWFVFGFGDMRRLNEFFLANFDTPIFTSITALVVQGMYAWRVYHLSKLKIVTFLIALCTLAQACGGIGIGIVNQRAETISNWQPHFLFLAIFWSSFSAAGDSLIAGSMTWLLLKSRGWKNADERNTAVTKIVRLTIETNVASAVVAIIVLLITVIPSIGPPNGSYFLCPSYVLGKVYSNSFFAMLNNRHFMKQDILRNKLGGGGRGPPQWPESPQDSGNGHHHTKGLPQPSYSVGTNDSTVGTFTLTNLKGTNSQV